MEVEVQTMVSEGKVNFSSKLRSVMMKEVFSNGAEITEIEHGVRENFKLISIKWRYLCVYDFRRELLNFSINLLYAGS